MLRITSNSVSLLRVHPQRLYLRILAVSRSRKVERLVKKKARDIQKEKAGQMAIINEEQKALPGFIQGQAETFSVSHICNTDVHHAPLFLFLSIMAGEKRKSLNPSLLIRG